VARGRCVAHGPDCEPLLVDVEQVARLDDTLLAEAEHIYEERFDAETGPQRLSANARPLFPVPRASHRSLKVRTSRSEVQEWSGGTAWARTCVHAWNHRHRRLHIQSHDSNPPLPV
jgi:hypothetical protein